MDIRVLQYFLTIAQEGSISAAAEVLHMTQPPLSRQLRMLEEELHTQLFFREKNRLTLTPKGELLLQYAQRIVRLNQQAWRALLTPQDGIHGDVYIGAAETDAVHIIISAVRTMRESNPLTKFHFFSSNALEITKKIEDDSLDFGVVFDPTITERYNFLNLFHRDTWGILMRKDSPLAAKESISPEDLWELPLIVSIQTVEQGDLSSWMHRDFLELNVVATYNLLFNASLMVREGLGYAICLYNLFDFSDNSPLCFRPLSPAVPVGLKVIWKKHKPLSNAAQCFIEVLTQQISKMQEY